MVNRQLVEKKITFSAWVLIIYTASLLQTKNAITEKTEIILNKWYFSGCIACKDVSLLNYFAVLTVQLYKKGKKLLFTGTVCE